MIYKACKPVYIKDFCTITIKYLFTRNLLVTILTLNYMLFFIIFPLPQFYQKYFSSSPVLSLQVLNQDLCNVGLDIFLIAMKSLEPVHILHILYHHSITVVHFMLYNLGCITTELAVFRLKIFIQIIHFYFFVSYAITNSIQ